jgi:threonine aldolase
MVDRMADDHANARKLANGLNEIEGISIEPDKLPTNLVFFEVNHSDRAGLARKLNERGVLGGGAQKRWRYVTHYGITEEDIDYTLEVFKTAFDEANS